jgi:phage terminase large subunit
MAENLIDDHIRQPGLDSVCIREVQKSLKDSAKKLIENKIQALGVGPLFEVQSGLIRTPGGGQIIFQGMQDHTAESIKSLEGFGRAWTEEAQTLSARSLEMLRPTIRAPGSELWFSWNPRRKSDPVDKFLRQQARDNAIVVQANWSDNPWFPPELEDERLDDKANNPDRYEHIWEGDYATAFEGAYFANLLREADRAGRIGDVTADPLLTVRSYHDIGGAGAKADAYTIWIVQFVGQSVRVLDYYESQGQTLAFHVEWMRKSGWEKAQVILPHDGTNTNNITGKKYRDHWEDAEFDVRTVPNQGLGAAMQRVEAVRRLMPSIWFNKNTTEAGREALGFYHEKRSEDRDIGLGPDHDWSSHAADAFGLMAVDHKPPEDSDLVKSLYGKSSRRGSYLNA